jgi:hypothetical protein
VVHSDGLKSRRIGFDSQTSHQIMNEDKSVEAVKKIFTNIWGEKAAPILQVIDMIAEMQHEKYPERPVFKNITLKGTEIVRTDE